MADLFGENHRNLLNLNRIADRGLEGPLQVKSEIFRFPATQPLTPADVLKSDLLKLPANSHLLSIRLIRTFLARLTVNFREEGENSVTQIYTEAANGAGDIEIGASALAAGAGVPVSLREPFFRDRKPSGADYGNLLFEIVPAANAQMRANVDYAVLILTYLNL